MYKWKNETTNGKEYRIHYHLNVWSMEWIMIMINDREYVLF